MTELLLALALGAAVGLAHPGVGRAIGRTLTAAVFAVVAIQGGVLGASDEVANAWGRTILHGAALAVLMAVFVTCSVEAVARLRGRRRVAEAGPAAVDASVDLKGPILILSMLVGGAVAGRLAPDGPWASLSTSSLLVLLFIVGADLGQQRRAIASQLRAAADVVWVAPVALVASGAAGWVASQFMPYGVAGPTAGALGSGWYSLAGPIITELDGPAVGGVVLLGNLLRETIAMLTIPWLAARGWSRQAAAALGGATAMDTTLPFVVRGWGARGAVTSLGVGVALSTLGAPLIGLVWELLARG